MSRSIANIEVDENKFNSTNETENLHLPQFIATDKPSWLGDFNGAMEVIDEAAEVLQEQITEQFEDLEGVHEQLNRVDDDVNNPETGVRQVLHDTQARVTDLETTVGDEQHGLVKDVHELQQDMVQTNTMAVKSNAQLGSIINLLCNKYSNAAQYSQGAYVYTENEDGSLNFLRCTQTTHGAFNPDKWEDVTEKLISALDNSGGGGGSQYVLPIAGDADDPDAVLGGVIIGEGLTIDPETGILSRTVTPTEGIGPDYYASQVRAGLVRPNTEAGLNVNSSNGVISIIIDDSTMEFTNDGKLKAKPDTSRFAQGQGISLSNENVPAISVRLAQENSNLGFDGNGGLRAILPSSAYDIVQGDGVTITTDAQTNTKTISMVQASTNTLGGVRPKSDSFAFESYDQEHPELKKMTIQLKDKGGLQKQDGVGLSVKVDGTTVQIDQTTGELKATGGSQYELPIASANTLGGIKVGQNLSIDPVTGVLDATGGSGSDYNPGDDSVEVNNVSHTIKVKKKNDGCLGVDSNGMYVRTGMGIVKQSNSLVVPKIGQIIDGVQQNSGTINNVRDYRVTGTGELSQVIKDSVFIQYMLAGFVNIPSRIRLKRFGENTYDEYTFNPYIPTLDTSVTPPVIDTSDTNIVKEGTRAVQAVIGHNVTANTTYQGNQYNAEIATLRCIRDIDINTLYEVVYNSETQEYEPSLRENVDLSNYFEVYYGTALSNYTYNGIVTNNTNLASVGIIGRESKYIPVNRILKTGDVDPTETNELLPRNSTVYPNNRSITVPDRSAYHPLMFMFPLYILPTSNFPITSNFNNYDIDITYFVDGDVGYGNLAQRVPLYEKTINVKPGIFAHYYSDPQTDPDHTTTVEVKDYRFGPRGDTTFYKYGCAVTYPMLVTNIVVCCRIEFTNISDGTVTRAYSEYTDSTTPDCNLYGATYLYDLAEQ